MKTQSAVEDFSRPASPKDARPETWARNTEKGKEERVSVEAIVINGEAEFTGGYREDQP